MEKEIPAKPTRHISKHAAFSDTLTATTTT